MKNIKYLKIFFVFVESAWCFWYCLFNWSFFCETFKILWAPIFIGVV